MTKSSAENEISPGQEVNIGRFRPEDAEGLQIYYERAKKIAAIVRDDWERHGAKK